MHRATHRAAHRAPQTERSRPGEGSGDGAEGATEAGMRLLSGGVPLTLLMDLAMPVDSAAIAADEGGSAAWLTT